MKKRITAVLMLLFVLSLSCPAFASAVPQKTTPEYKVAFYAFDCYHMQDSNGKRFGYGYEMMEGISKYLQCTFSYVGYDKSPAECVEMLRNGELDIYTAAKLTPEREEEFAISTHPAITATTCMNVKVGNTHIVAGDYSTYEGIRIGLLRRHTYNDAFLAFAKEKGFSHEIIYYETPTELTNALIDDEVDALVNSYIRIPEDECMVENFGQTPYYIMARKQDQKLIDEIDAAIDSMNTETPNWRTELYNKYYGSQALNTELTGDEEALLQQMKEDGTVIRAVMNPDSRPYSWYENGEARGIAADLFKATAEELGLKYEFVPADSKEEYLKILQNGDADVWMDMDYSYDDDKQFAKYKSTNAYLRTTVSVLRNRSASSKIHKLGVLSDTISMKEIASAMWKGAKLVVVSDTQECVKRIVNGELDGALLMTYTAQHLAQSDIQNRLRVDIVPGASLDMRMGVNAEDDCTFYGIWEKTLSRVSQQMSAEIVQSYVEATAEATGIKYLFDHPVYFIVVITILFLIVFLLVLYLQSVRSRNKQEKISAELAAALEDAREATLAKQDFFSKMSHDIRTPLNVVLGMTQIAQKYKHDTKRLENALDSIASEGNYLLELINSILDVNQLEHGHMELQQAPFDVVRCAQKCIKTLMPLAEKKEQQLTLACSQTDLVVVGDASRFSQIMMNIVANAVKYTDAGGKIEVSLECMPDGHCRFTCTDNGIGMTEEFVAHITEDYVRAEDSRVSKTQGTGLGMSVVQGFTNLMHGTLQVKSKLGVGSTFVVEIPFEQATEQQKKAALQPDIRRSINREKYIGKKVLLAEDNALNAEIAIELLESIGLTVDWAENGQLAVQQFEQSKDGEYFAVFMDMQMPVTDGVEATKLIRSSHRADHGIPIFAMTANTFAADRKRCKDAGMDGYISKPLNMEDIQTTIQNGTKN